MDNPKVMPYPLKESFFKKNKVYLERLDNSRGLVAIVVTELGKLHIKNKNAPESKKNIIH